ncbi:MAG: hypothetical protein AAF790_13245 [Planctomycetota bacterium]
MRCRHADTEAATARTISRAWPVLLAAAVLAAAPTTPIASAQTGVQQPTLKERLLFGLQARRPSEKRFIDAVVDTVERGELPLRLVDRTFFWARSRTPKRPTRRSRRAIIYFQPALTIQAQRLRINIRPNPPPPAS